MVLHMCVTRGSLGHGRLCAIHRKSFTVKALAAHAPGLQWNGITAMLREATVWACYGHVMVTLWLLLQLLHQAGDSLCYGCRAGQETVNVSAAPEAPQVSFQPLSSGLAYHRFGEQCYTVRYSETGVN